MLDFSRFQRAAHILFLNDKKTVIARPQEYSHLLSMHSHFFNSSPSAQIDELPQIPATSPPACLTARSAGPALGYSLTGKQIPSTESRRGRT